MSRSGSEASDKEEVAWYDDPNMMATKKGDNRWTTLSHNGPYFSAPYKPHGISIDYNGEEFKMNVEEEEAATFYAVMRESPYYSKPMFQGNFMSDFVSLLNRTRGRGNHPIKHIGLINFDRIWNWHVTEKAKRDAMSKEEKKKIKDALAKEMEPYQYCKWDGRKERVANFRVEPPGLFRGRGDHPKQGMIKIRVNPEDVTINVGADQPVPQPPAGHRWKEVIHDRTVTWLAFWGDNVTGGHKYVMLHPSAAIKGLSDREKFEKARLLKQHIGKVREYYQEGWYSNELITRQKCVAMYFIDKLALRVGNEKEEGEEADTVGCCSLRVEHVTPQMKSDGAAEDYTLHFNFLGKDSIRYINDVTVDPKVWELVREFRRGKIARQEPAKGDQLFELVESSTLNDQFKEFMPGLTAKVFRTYNASITLEQELGKTPVNKDDTVDNKLLAFTKANTRVAILCNHQKTVSKAGHVSMRNMEMKKGFSERNVEIMRECAKLEEEDDEVAARKHFIEEHIKIQDEWMDKWGKEEDKQAWAEEKEALLEEAENAPAKGKLPKKREGAVTKKRERGGPRVKKEEESSDEDDRPLFSILNASKKNNNNKKPLPKIPRVKKEEAKNDDEDSDDELLLAGFNATSSSKKSPASSTKKKAAKKEESESEEDEDDESSSSEDAAEESSSEEEEEDDSPKKKKTPARASKGSNKGGNSSGKKPASKKAGGKKSPAAASSKGKKAAPKKGGKKK